MTVVPAGPGRARLICDACGGDVEVPDHDLRDDDVVWPLLGAEGWAGSAFAAGPHQCPHCAGTSLLAPAGTAHRPRPEPAPDPSPVPVRHLPEATVVCVDGDVDLLMAARLRATLAPIAGAGRDAILDLAGTGIIDSAGLSTLVRAQQEAREAGVVVMLAAPSRFIRTVLHTMHLARAFPMFHDVASAVAWRRSSRGRDEWPAGTRTRPGGGVVVERSR